ncbi:hypothetical protein, partial [Streptomyces antibioticus]|uniref:hypothetical protein n=1 Tax=Streptomyces antibioticus TaxID=1890 RepID=UPI003F4BEE02
MDIEHSFDTGQVHPGATGGAAETGRRMGLSWSRKVGCHRMRRPQAWGGTLELETIRIPNVIGGFLLIVHGLRLAAGEFGRSSA